MNYIEIRLIFWRHTILDYIKQLISEAIISRKKAYTPYSKFKVGAALITKSGEIYGGFNIECAAYSACNCAERTAVFRAVFDGHRDFEAIAVVGGSESEEEIFSSFCPPCGVCRQVLREFCNPKEFKIILAKSVSEYKVYTLEELLPESFGPENL